MARVTTGTTATPRVPGSQQASRIDLGAEMVSRFNAATKTAFSLDLQSHAMTIQGGLRALSSLIAEGKGAPNNDAVGAFASDLAALVGLIADAVQPLCEENAA